MLIVNLKNKSIVSVGTVLLASSVIFSGCIKENIIEVPKSKKLIIEGYKGVKNDNPNSRVYWEEDGSVSGGLAFHWENSEDGKEDMAILISKGQSFMMFGSQSYSWGIVNTTSNPLVSKISLKSTPNNSEDLKKGYKIYSYLPLTDGEFMSTDSPTISMSIPGEISNVKLNSTRHLSPYSFMEGNGEINEQVDFLTSRIDYSLIPAIIRFKIENADTEDFTPTKVGLSGRLSTTATITFEKKGVDNPYIPKKIYSTGDRVHLKIDAQETISAEKSANAYCLVFPTDFTNKKVLVELEGKYKDKHIKRLAYIPMTLTDNSLKSNYCYTFKLKVSKNSFEMEQGKTEDWNNGDTEESEEVTTQPENQ